MENRLGDGMREASEPGKVTVVIWVKEIMTIWTGNEEGTTLERNDGEN